MKIENDTFFKWIIHLYIGKFFFEYTKIFVDFLRSHKFYMYSINISYEYSYEHFSLYIYIWYINQKHCLKHIKIPSTLYFLLNRLILILMHHIDFQSILISYRNIPSFSFMAKLVLVIHNCISITFNAFILVQNPLVIEFSIIIPLFNKLSTASWNHHQMISLVFNTIIDVFSNPLVQDIKFSLKQFMNYVYTFMYTF